MKILITGASSGIGMAMAKLLYKDNEIIAVARSKEKLDILEKTTGCVTEVCDVSDFSQCRKLFEKYTDIDVLINNAGFGDLGYLNDTDLDKGINMINTNVTGLHALTKMYLDVMVKRNSGYILNVSSIASFFPGPLMATYYATKAYVTHLSKAISYELKKQKSNVYIGVLCPGPVDTNFNKVANCKFNLKSQTAEKVAIVAIKNMFKRKTVICTSFGVKLARIGSKILPDSILMKFAYMSQRKKYYK
ncbi:MAG: SDR family NAD(P)-dependent oxidoreductase [Clostridia bacterium]|nr:SDR family NAD(P)-dependent oxidoreductase [Clostridia bacterium]